MRRLCIATDALDATGAGRQVVGIVARLREEYETTVVCARRQGALAHEVRRLGAVVHVWNTRGRGALRLKRRFLRLFRSHRPDILHTMMSGSGYPACWAARETGLPVIVSGRRTLRQGRDLAMQVRANQYVDRVVCNSRVLAAAASAAEDGDFSRYHAIHDGCDPAWWELGPPPDEGGAERAAPLELVAVTSTPDPAPLCPPSFARTAALASAQSPRLRFTVLHTPAAARGAAGATPGKEARIAHLAAPEEREDFYRAANVFVACEPHHELPFSALLAMACGAPVLAWKGSATAELVEHDRTGVLTDDPGPDAAAAALVRLAAEPERGASLGRRAAQWVRDERSLERAAREYGRCYRELLAAKFHRGT